MVAVNPQMYLLVVGFFIGYFITIILYRYFIIRREKTICPICGQETKGQYPCYFMRNRKVYRVHQGDCTEIFLYGERKYGLRFLNVLDKSINDRFSKEILKSRFPKTKMK